MFPGGATRTGQGEEDGVGFYIKGGVWPGILSHPLEGKKSMN